MIGERDGAASARDASRALGDRGAARRAGAAPYLQAVGALALGAGAWWLLVGPPPPVSRAVPRPLWPEQAGDEPSVRVVIEDGPAPTTAADAQPTRPAVTPLSDIRTQALLARLPERAAREVAAARPARPAASLVPAADADTTEEIDALPALPALAVAPPARDVRDSDTPRVVRITPEGDAITPPRVAITFSRPMVAVTGHADAARAVSATITPRPPGAWRWVGARTLVFEPDAPGFPAATEYTVEVPSGTRTAAGAALVAPARVRFRTPAPRVIELVPREGPVPPRPVLVAVFDQRIDPAAVLATVHIAAGGRRYAVRAASDAELASARQTDRVREAGASDDRLVAFRPIAPLPEDADVEVVIGPGTPSAEGPRVTEDAQRFILRTIERLRVSERSCAGTGEDDACPPERPWVIAFNDALDPGRLSAVEVLMSPPVPDLEVTVDGPFMTIRGRTRPDTVYHVTLPAGLTGERGSRLGRPVQLPFRVGKPPRPRMLAGGPCLSPLCGPGRLIALDPAADRATIEIGGEGIQAVRVQVFAVQPEDWGAFARYAAAAEDSGYDGDVDGERRGRDGQAGERATPPGVRVADTTLTATGSATERVVWPIELSPALSGGLGHAVVIAEPVRWVGDDRPVVRTWVQVTRIAIDAMADDTAVTAWVTDLADGAPLSGVHVEHAPSGGSAITSGSPRGDHGPAAAPAGDGHGESGDGGDDGARVPGLVEIPLLSGNRTPHLDWLIARRGQDSAILPESVYRYGAVQGWTRRGPDDEVRWYVASDRGLYRPGETARIKGWLRRWEAREGGDLVHLGAGGEPTPPIRYRLVDSRGGELASGDAALSPLGGFDLALPLPADAAVGPARLELSVAAPDVQRGDSHVHRIGIEEFRRPEYEVAVTPGPGPHIAARGVTVTATARYFAGGTAPDAPVRWSVTATETEFVPPGRRDYQFGAWSPRRPWEWGGGFELSWSSLFAGEAAGEHTGRTDRNGDHTVRVRLEDAPPRPFRVTARASIADIDRQEWQGETTVVVHPAALYVGLRATARVIEQGQPIAVDVIAVDHDGAAVPGRAVTVTATRNRDWAEGGDAAGPAETCEVATGEAPSACRFATPAAGRYTITARIVDGDGRASETEATVWVSGGRTDEASGELVADWSFLRYRVQEQELDVIPDADEYAPGDTARLLVRSPVYPAHGLITLWRNGMVSAHSVSFAGPSAVVDIPIEDAHVPGLAVYALAVGSEPRSQRDSARKPAFATTRIALPVSPRGRRLTVDVAPAAASGPGGDAAQVAPGDRATVEVAVRYPDGAPAAGAEVAAIVVDEAVLSLGGYRLPDPIDVFYERRFEDVESYLFREYVRLTELGGDLVAEADRGESGDEREVPPVVNGLAKRAAVDAFRDRRAAGARNAEAVVQADGYAALDARSAGILGALGVLGPARVRRDFAALAAFVPSVTTDARGRAALSFTVPDSLTRYRVMVVAAAGARQFGTGESAITAALPLMLRASPPRFATAGDAFALPVVIHNRSRRALAVSIAARADGLAFPDGAGRAVEVAAGARVEVALPVVAERPDRFGLGGTREARVEVVAVGAPLATSGAAGPGVTPAVRDPDTATPAIVTDAAELAFPIHAPLAIESFASYGDLGGEARELAVRQPIAIPGDAEPGIGGLALTASSTQLQALTDALLYLVAYPHECAEQVSSRLLAVAALRDVLTAFDADGLPPPGDIDAAMARDIARLSEMQAGDGGFGFWRGTGSWPFVTVHVGHALARARDKGYPVPASMIESLLDYLRALDEHLPASYPAPVTWSLRAYALAVRARLGEPDAGAVRALLAEPGLARLPLEAAGWLLAAVSGDRTADAERAAIRRHLLSRAVETAEAAHFAADYATGAELVLHGEHRADAVILEALIASEPTARSAEDAPAADLIPKLARGLLAARANGRWRNTQDNAFALLALDRYFESYERVEPAFTARMWLADRPVMQRAFRGRDTASAHVVVPMSALADAVGARGADVVVSRAGAGRLYYRIGLTYASGSASARPVEQGFAVTRGYEPIDDEGDVAREPDGTWRVRAGARVRVRVRIATAGVRHHVAVVDHLPGGLEPLNPALSATPRDDPGAVADDGDDPLTFRTDFGHWGTRGSGRWVWFDHQELRDDRAQAYATRLPAGAYEYVYTARATTRGRFRAPPATAEEMYAPESFGRSAADAFAVE